MSSSILNNTKKLLGILPEQKDFDTDIIVHINSAFYALNQLGVGPKTTFFINSEEETFSDFEPDDTKYTCLPLYLFFKTKLGFDPSSVGSATLTAIKDQIAELEWRMMVESELENPEDVKIPMRRNRTGG